MIFKKILLLLMLFISLIVLCSGCGSKDESYKVNSESQLILRLAETQPCNYPSTQGAKEFARLVDEKSEGRIKVKVYDSGGFGDETSVIEQVQFGGVDLARVSLASLDKYSAKVKIMMLPYLFRSSEHIWKVLDGPIGVELKDSLLKENIVCLAWYEGGARSFYNSKREIKNIEELRGLKLSVQRSPMIMDMYSYVGVSLVPTKASDIYSALQTGFIDGAEDNIITYYISKHYEVAKYLTYDEHARTPEVIIGSRVTMMRLSKKDQVIIEQAAKQSAFVQRQLWVAKEKEAFNELMSMGVEFIWANDQSRDDFLSTVQPFYNSFPKKEVDAITK